MNKVKLSGLDRPEILQRFDSNGKIYFELDNLPKDKEIHYTTTSKLVADIMNKM